MPGPAPGQKEFAPSLMQQKIGCPDVGLFWDAEKSFVLLKHGGASKEFGNPVPMRAFG
jgi:hypothetical protein